MKKTFFVFFLLTLGFTLLSDISFSAEFGYVPVPDKELSVLQDASREQESELIPDNSTKKKKDPRTLKEKTRAKLHLPPSKKIYYHNIDKSSQPITMDDYYKLSAEKKRKDFVIPQPSFDEETDIILPDPKFKVIRFNTPPGQRNIDMSSVISQNVVHSPGILSPDKTKMVFTKSFFFKQYSQIGSGVYVVNVDSPSDPYEILSETNIMQSDIKPIFTSGLEDILKNRFVTLFPLDWSKDSQKIAFKEKTGSVYDGTWQTSVIIYDFKTKSWKRLDAVREAVLYWWRLNRQIDLKDYLWDIYPVGWDKDNPDRFVVYAYAFTYEKPFFLGTWSIDFDGEKSSLISVDSTSVTIDLNGFGLKEVRLQN